MWDNLKEKVYSIVKERIISGTYRPNTHLDEKKLINELEVSRTPFREAMNRLELESFIKIIPRRGFFVTEVSIKNITDIFQTRQLLEPEIVQVSFDNINRAKLLELKQRFINWESLSRDTLNALDWELHYLILESNNNSFLMRMISNIYEHNQRIRTLATRPAIREKETALEHIEIIDAILSDDITRAKKACRVHTVNSKLNALEMIGLLNM